jgi:hypothetical protein
VSGCTGPKQTEVPVSNQIDVPLPDLETDVTREAETVDKEEAVQEAEVTKVFAAEIEIEEPASLPEESTFVPYDIPLSPELQRFTYDLCKERGLDFEIVLALMYAESSYRPHIISRTNDYGLMQLNRVNHNRLAAELGITDFLDAEQNINAGTFLLMELAEKYPDTHKMLMAYNFGEAGARRHWNRGTYSSRYSRKITAKADELRNQRIADDTQ